MKVIVIYGGSSSEREVSLRSGAAVAAALEKAGHEARLYDPGEDASFAGLKSLAKDADVAFPIIHGKGAEDGAVQAVLEELGLPFVGSSSKVSAACLDKWNTLQTVKAAGIVTADSQVVTIEDLATSPLSKKPFVLKPIVEGSSIDTFLIREPEQFDTETVRAAFDRHGKLLMEALVDGYEVTVPVLGDEALPVIEIVPPEGGFFDLANKYNGRTQELCPPQNVPEDVQQQAQDIALRVHRLMGCHDLSRTDIMVDRAGTLYFLEINTLPGMTNESLFPKSAAVTGLDMPKLMDKLVQMAYAR